MEIHAFLSLIKNICCVLKCDEEIKFIKVAYLIAVFQKKLYYVYKYLRGFFLYKCTIIVCISKTFIIPICAGKLEFDKKCKNLNLLPYINWSSIIILRVN